MKPHLVAGLLLVAAALLSFSACTGAPVDLDPKSNGLKTISDWGLVWYPPEVIVLVVDDAPTPEAAALRARMVETVQAGLESAHHSEHWGSCASNDPAQWHPADVRVVVARPSAPDGESLLTEVQSPDLSWVTKMSAEEQIPPVVAATSAALEQRTAKAGELFRPLHAVKRTLEMLSGVRKPETADEAAFFGSISPEARAWIIVAATRDDEAPDPADDFLLDVITEERVLRVAVVSPFEGEDNDCDVDLPSGPTRIEWWGQQMSAFFRAFPCEQASPWFDHLLSHCCADCGAWCHDRPLAVDPDGRVECRIFVDQQDLSRCDPERGWEDPDGQVELVDRHGETRRRCEIRQHEGAALEACRTSLECPGCGSGFCVTEVPELDESEYCTNSYATNLRFTGGALDALHPYLLTLCSTE